MLLLALCFTVAGVDRAGAEEPDLKYKSTWVPLPTNEDPPLCATTGHRIKVVYYKPSLHPAATPQIESDLRSIVNRMNWKIRSQALLSSGNNVPLEMRVDCDATGQPRIYSLQTDFDEIYSALGRPRGAQAVKYLVFFDGSHLPDGESDGQVANNLQERADPRYTTKSISDEPASETSQSNYSRVESSYAAIWRSAGSQNSVDVWHSHVTVHELFHAMGAVQPGTESDPNKDANSGGHCTGNIDLMCEPGLIGNGNDPCPKGGSEPFGPLYETPAGMPLDCHFDTYFDAQPEAGEWLTRNWNVGGPENPYLANPNTYVPQVKAGLGLDLASSAANRLDLVARVPDSSLRYRSRTNGTWATNWTSLGGSLTGAPVLISPEAGRLDVFACSYDGTVAHRTYSASTWGPWQSLGSGGSGCSGLDAVSWGPGRLDVVVRDGANLYHRSKSGETWGSWTTLANAGTFTVSSLPTLVSRKSGELTLFVRNGSSDIQARVFANNAWGSWESIGSPISGTAGVPEAVASESSTQPAGMGYVFSSGGWDSGAWARKVFDGGMSIWTYLKGGENVNGKFAAVARPDQAVDLYGIDTSGRMQGRARVYEASTAWRDLGGQFREVAPEATAVNTGGAWLNAVGAIGEDGKLYIGDDGAAGWGGWKQVALPTDVSEKDAFDIPEGRPWQIRPTPLPNPAIRRPEAVSCAAPDACLAVGNHGEYADAMRWDGIHWSNLTGLGLPVGAQGSALKGISCTSPTLCTAVGDYRNSSGVSLPWALRWNGSTWTSQEMPSVASGDASLSAVSCTSPEACTAVGDYEAAGGEHEPLVLRWTGGPKWTQASLTGPVGDAYLKGISCSSATDCRAVGYYHGSSGWRMIAAGGSGATWSLQYPPHPNGATLSHLYGVSCTAANACTAVGITQDSGNLAHSLAMRWNGSSWAVQSTPAPAGSSQSDLHAVSCVSSTACVATGLRSGGGPQSPMAMRWDGTSWSVEPTPDPSGTLNYVGLYGVSCTHVNACMAVGWQQTGSSELIPLTERLQGGPPSITAQPVSGVAKNQATLRSWVNPNGSATSYRFEWGATTAYGNTVPATAQAIGSGLVDAQVDNQISGLVGEQTYHYRVVAENAEGTTFGSDQQFTTPMWKPAVTVESATGVGGGQATLRGTVKPNEFATTYQFEWGATIAYGNTVPATPKNVGAEVSSQSVSETINGLVGGNTYHYRIKATNSEGTVYSADQPLVTINWKPSVATNSASEVLRETARFHADINPNGLATTYQFQYGTTKSFGTSVPATPASAGSGKNGVPVSFNATGLKPFTTYYYRVVATNVEGTANGEAQAFTTHANNFWTEKAPATLFGQSSGAHSIITGTLKLTCTAAAYNGTREVQKGETLTLIPAYAGCNISGSLTGATPVSMGGCKFELDVDGVVAIGGATCATAPITYSVTYSASVKCTISIGPQTLANLNYEVTGSGSERKLAVTQQLAGLKYTATGSICPKPGTFSDGTYSGSALLQARSGGIAQGLWAE